MQDTADEPCEHIHTALGAHAERSKYSQEAGSWRRDANLSLVREDFANEALVYRAVLAFDSSLAAASLKSS
jgi:hypothetical protein